MYTTEIVAFSVTFLSPKGGSGEPRKQEQEDGGYQVLAMIIGEALTEVMDLIKKH